MDSHEPVEEFKLFFRRLPKESNSLGYSSNALESQGTGERGGGGSRGGQKYSERLQSLQHQSQQYRNSAAMMGVSGRSICPLVSQKESQNVCQPDEN